MPLFDWEQYWRVQGENDAAYKFALTMADKIFPLMEENNFSTFADFGCGPATMLFKLADLLPDTRFFGYDLARSIIEQNNDKGKSLRLQNLTFIQASLPSVKKDTQFDIVTCFSTLHYIDEIEQTIENLFTLVTNGGYLIFNYPNIFTWRMYQHDLSPDDEDMRRRFKVLLSQKNLLTQKRIKTLLGRTPRKFYSSIKGNIYLKIKK